jgi:hypothetical protein
VKREPVRSELRRRHLFATVKQSVTVLVQWAHRMTEDTVDCKFCWRALSRLTIRRRGQDRSGNVPSIFGFSH